MNTLTNVFTSDSLSSVLSNFITKTSDATGFYPAIITTASIIGVYPIYYVTSNILMYIFDYKYIHINTSQFVDNLKPFIDYSTILTSCNHKCGYILSKNFKLFGYLYLPYDSNSSSSNGYIYISNKFIADHKLLVEKAVEIKTYEKTKHYCKVYNAASASYSHPSIYVNNICWDKNPTNLQLTIMEQITEQLHKSKTNNCVVLLSGTIGTGKSMLCRLLAESLNASIYDEYSLCESADYTFDGIINVLIKPTKKEPLVFVLEEIDIVINTIHNTNVTPNAISRIPVKNKSDWNNFLDRIDYGQYPNVVLVMTTNKPRQWFDDLDPSYMREGRVNLHIDTDLVAADIALCNKDD